MNLIELKDISNFNNILQKLRFSHFFQTTEWSGLLKKVYNINSSFFILKDGTDIISAFVVRWKYSFFSKKMVMNIAKGPALIDTKYLSIVLNMIIRRFRFSTLKIRLCPYIFNKTINNMVLLEDQISNMGWKKADIFYYYNKTILIDLTLDYDVLYKNYNTNTKRNLKKALKAGIVIKKAKEKDLFKILEIYNKNAEFKGYGKVSLLYLEELYLLSEEEKVDFYISEYSGNILGGMIFIKFNKSIIYLHGFSNVDYRNLLPDTHLIVDSVIRTYAGGEYNILDLAGISKDNVGISRFKLGFSKNINELFPELEFYSLNIPFVDHLLKKY